MDVTRIEDATGSHIEPPLDETWDDLTKLTWHAAVITHDTGIPIHVGYYGGRYGIQVGDARSGGSHSLGGRSYDSAWTLIVGIHLGAQAAQGQASNDPTSKEQQV